jgi:hypothetical protein
MHLFYFSQSMLQHGARGSQKMEIAGMQGQKRRKILADEIGFTIAVQEEYVIITVCFQTRGSNRLCNQIALSSREGEAGNGQRNA